MKFAAVSVLLLLVGCSQGAATANPHAIVKNTKLSEKELEFVLKAKKCLESIEHTLATVDRTQELNHLKMVVSASKDADGFPETNDKRLEEVRRLIGSAGFNATRVGLSLVNDEFKNKTKKEDEPLVKTDTTQFLDKCRSDTDDAIKLLHEVEGIK